MAIGVRILLGFVALVLVLAAIAVGIVLTTDVNRFKPTLSRWIEDHGLWVRLEGELSWSLYPSLAIAADRVQLDWRPEPATPLMAARRVELGIEFLPLLSTKPVLKLRTLQIEGLTLQLERDAQGHENWHPPVSASAPGSGGGIATDLAALRFDHIAISDGQITYRNLATNQTIVARNLDVDMTDPAFGTPFPVAIRLDAQEQATHVLMNLAAKVTLDASATRFALEELRVSGNLRREGLRDVRYSIAGRMSGDAETATATLKFDPFSFGRARLRLSTTVSGLSTVPKLSGHLDADVPSTAALGEQLGIGKIPAEHVALITDYGIAGQNIALTNMHVTLDESTLHGDLQLLDKPTRELTFTLATDALRLDRYLEAWEAEGSEPAPSSVAHEAQLFRREMISWLHWNGRLRAKRVVARGLDMSDVEITTQHRDALVNNTIDVGGFMKGRVAAGLDLDATDVPHWSAALTMNDVDAQEMVDWLGFKTTLEGRFQVGGNLTATGDTQRALAKSLAGKIVFNGGTGTADVTPIKDIGMSVAALAGNKKKVEKWPDTMNYRRLKGSLRLNGIDDEEFEFTLDNFELSGKGGYDLARKKVDFKASFVFRGRSDYSSFDVPDVFAGVSFPVRCKGRLDADRLCELSKDAAAKIVAQLLTKQLPLGIIKGIENVITAPAKIVKEIDEKSSSEAPTGKEEEQRTTEGSVE